MIARVRSVIGFSLLLALAAGPAPAATTMTLVLRDTSGAAVPGAVVYLEGADHGPVTVPVTVTVDQRDRTFVPQVTVIQAGTHVNFPNSDTVSHHVYSFAKPNSFELPLYKGGTRPSIQFDHAGVVTLGCNIHDAMVGWIVVVETPHFGFTDDQGSVAISGLTPGSYQVRAWSPRLDPAKPLDAGVLPVGAANVTAAVSVARRLRAAPVGGNALAGGDY